MKQFPLIVSYYTRETPYEIEVKNLIASVAKFHLEAHIEPITSFGSWEKNCGYKPLFLLQMLEKFQRPLFWVDADAVFLKMPEYLTVFSSDLAVRMNREWKETHPSYVMSGSIYINHTEVAKKILKCWASECIAELSDPQRTIEMWDQITLRNVLNEKEYSGVIESLPIEYTLIVDHPEDKKKMTEAVIGHYQASRRFKKIVNIFDGAQLSS